MIAGKAETSLFSNVLLSVGSRVALGLIGLVTIPVLVHRLGPAAFGVYVVSISLTGLISIFDLGLTAALVNQLARARAAADTRQIQAVVATAMSMFLILGGLFAAVLAISAPVISTGLLHLRGGLAGPATTALRLSAVGLGLGIWLSALDAIPVALERYDIVAARVSAISVASAAAGLLYVLRGGGLVGLIAINVLATAVGVLIFYRVATVLLPEARFLPGASLDAFRSQLRFGAFKFAGTISAAAVFRFDQIAIAAILGITASGFYAVPSVLLTRLLSLLATVSAPIFPRVSSMNSTPDTLAGLYISANRLMVLVAFPAAAVLIAAPTVVIGAWIGGSQGAAVAQAVAPATRWLMLAFAIQSVAAVPAVFCEATGRPWINNSFAVASLALHIPLILLLVPRLGLEGAGIALLLNSLVQTLPFIFYATKKVVGLSFVTVFREGLGRPLVASAAPAVVAVAGSRLVTGRISLLAMLATAALSFAAAALATKAVTIVDLRRAQGLVLRGRERRTP